MDAVVYHFVSGEAFFSGAALLTLSAALAVLVQRRWARIAARLSAIVGLLFAALSATPFGLWVYVVWSALVLAWLIAPALGAARRTTALLAAAAGILSVGLAAAELPHHTCPCVPAGRYDVVYVVGDSISSGVRTNERTWPAVLADRLGVPVVNLAEAGATAEAAEKQAEKVGPGPAIVLIEIGGNDLLGDTSATEFETALRQLLQGLRSPERTLIMFELPLPPLCNAYGRAQRRLSREFGVFLIPRRLFAGVLMATGSTVDGIHLSPKGHGEMAGIAAKVLRGAVPSPQATGQA